MNKTITLGVALVLCLVSQLSGADKKPVEIPEGVTGLAALCYVWAQDPEVHKLWMQAAVEYDKTVADLRAKQKTEKLTQEEAIQKYGGEFTVAYNKRAESFRQGADRIKSAAHIVDEATEAKENKAKKKMADELKKDDKK